ncbi:ABC transporter ATP-binding protein [Aquibacillus albus]|uniref:NitT/TauT family transport system ATP-binding protein n=1 Tax=Aquibacillus albus TaxID=1168171 RepID=A0ABS2N5K7_9BACI|nr:ABC transporter ATP-binding protein [Aquibacillus albus]MBM7573404.1 NitT/TauT family transport system ATP-binding protein [Aquibacillus albus]
MAQIELNDVCLRYFTINEETEALRNVNLSVDEGEFISIVGPSGCGKSTLLSLVSGVIKPTEGEVTLFGEKLKETSDRIGYMLQNDHLFEWRNVLNNLLVGAEIRGINRKEAKERALDLLNRYGMGDFAHHSPKQLSGGMRQRVALIRTLVIQPEILLLDEPFSALDYQTRLTLSDEISTILREQKKTVVLVTHDISEAIAMADRVIVMSKRPSFVKRDYKISFAGGRPSPFYTRQAPEYNDYFNEIWKELEEHVHA